MRRIRLVVAIEVLMVAMLAASALPALAQDLLQKAFTLLPTRYQPRVRAFIDQPRVSALLDILRYQRLLNYQKRGYLHNTRWQPDNAVNASVGSAYAQSSTEPSNPLQTYFDSHTEGRGIWKYRHYFEIYQRHFSKFVDQEVHVLEIGVFSGGSLEMWKQYFGPKCRVYGVDIQEACKAYADDRVEIFIGDQTNRNFWTRFKEEVPLLDIIIDDGGHEVRQQMITLEEMLPHLRAGGVYLCEDVDNVDWRPNPFLGYINGLSLNLHTAKASESGHTNTATQFQKSVHSVHLYPFVTVIEKTETPVDGFGSQKQGTQWEPFW